MINTKALQATLAGDSGGHGPPWWLEVLKWAFLAVFLAPLQNGPSNNFSPLGLVSLRCEDPIPQGKRG